MDTEKLTLSTLAKTWIFDFDGTVVRHNGYKQGKDEFLPGAKEFLQKIPEKDFILILTAREKEARAQTEQFLARHNVRYDLLLMEMPMGERILFNDSKPSGLKMSYAVECSRDEGFKEFSVSIDPSL